MDRFDNMRVFAKVVESGSFAGAAARLGISASMVSQPVKELEERLAVRLLNRTTREVSLTETGQPGPLGRRWRRHRPRVPSNSTGPSNGVSDKDRAVPKIAPLWEPTSRSRQQSPDQTPCWRNTVGPSREDVA